MHASISINGHMYLGFFLLISQLVGISTRPKGYIVILPRNLVQKCTEQCCLKTSDPIYSLFWSFFFSSFYCDEERLCGGHGMYIPDHCRHQRHHQSSPNAKNCALMISDFPGEFQKGNLSFCMNQECNFSFEKVLEKPKESIKLICS